MKMPALARSILIGALASVSIGLASQAAMLHQIATIPIPGAPLEAYDVGLVDHGRYYMSDRSNKSVDIFDAKTNKFLSRVTGFAGVGPHGSSDSGPNAITVVHNGREIWGTDGDSSVKVVDVKKGAIVDSISTGGKMRTHAGDYDPNDEIFLVGNDSDEPPFLTFISTKPGHKVVGKITLPRATDGLETPVYDAKSRMFYVTVPVLDKDEHKGAILIVDPRKLVVMKTIEIADCYPQGLAKGRGTNWIVGCSAGSRHSKLPPKIAVFDSKTEKLVATTDKMGGADAAVYDKKYDLYLMGGREAPGGPSVGVIDAKTNQWIENISIPPNPHSLAVDQSTGHIFVPSGATGGVCNGCVVVLGK
jgi:DNA-binding beta-propeller fold protein YncE